MAKCSKRVHGTHLDDQNPVPRRTVDGEYFPAAERVVPARMVNIWYMGRDDYTKNRTDVCTGNICINTMLKNHEGPVMRAAETYI